MNKGNMMYTISYYTDVSKKEMCTGKHFYPKCISGVVILIRVTYCSSAKSDILIQLHRSGSAKPDRD
jgi:predicted aconitase with swiveling domain